MLNCCRAKQNNRNQPDSSAEEHRNSLNKMPTKSPVSTILSIKTFGCIKRKSKVRLKHNSLTHFPSNPVESIHQPELPSFNEESENQDCVGNLPFDIKFNVEKPRSIDGDNKYSSNLVVQHNIPNTTVAASRRGSLYIFRHSDDLIVTPFAQILASLRNVRANFILITNVHSSRDARFGSISTSSHTLKSEDTRPESDDQRTLTLETLEELEWCLEQLESIQTHRSVSDMASSKFKKILNKELSQFADQTKSGNQISDYICTTFLDTTVDSNIDHQSDIEEGDINLRRSSKVAKFDDLPDTDIYEKQVDGASPLISTERHRTQKHVTLKTQMTDSDNVCYFGIRGSRYDELSKIIDETLETWGMDIFLVSNLSDNQPLTVISFALFRKFQMFDKFNIPSSTFLKFISDIESRYHDDVPYHNSTHAADVTQSTNVLLGASSLENVFSDLEIFAVLFACIVHDVDHPGVTNQYLINTNDQLALLYNDSSVLENHHLSVAFTVLSQPQSDILGHLTKKQRQSFRKMVIDMVLATDMSKHMSLLADLKTMVETKKVAGSGILNLDNYNDRIQILQNMVHCADLSNPTKPLELYKHWTERIMNEFFRQGDKERIRNLEISPMCDRETATVEKSQVSFIDFIVHPLWETWSDLVYPEAQEILDRLEENREWYSNQISKAVDEPKPIEDND